MNEEQIKQYYERIEKLLNGASKETYGFAPEEIRQILRWYEVLQQENQSLKDRIEKAEKFCKEQKQKMYKNRNKISVFILSKIQELLKGDK